MQGEIHEFRRRDVAVLAIGQGTGDESARFARKWGVEFPIYGDTTGAAYGAYGMHRGGWWTVLFRSLLSDPATTVQRLFQADLEGARLAAADVLRLGGVAIIGKGGALRFLHRADEPADIPPNADVLAAVDSL